jgi:nucleoside phosphorylase
VRSLALGILRDPSHIYFIAFGVLFSFFFFLPPGLRRSISWLERWLRGGLGLAGMDYETKETARLNEPPSCDFVIVCAVEDEFKALETVLGKGKEEVRVLGDPQTYYRWTLNADGRDLQIVAGQPTTKGSGLAGILATKLIMHFRPTLVAMVGISAGNKEYGVAYGDILVANPAWNYEFGRRMPNGAFQPDPLPIPLDARLADYVKELKRDRVWLDEIKRQRKESGGEVPKDELQIHLGAIATGSAVIEDPRIMNEMISHKRDLVGLEMEIYGVYEAARNTRDPAPLFIAFKSVSDFPGDDRDGWIRRYAAYTSAAYCVRFLRGLAERRLRAK